jgi:hypothetical protein
MDGLHFNSWIPRTFLKTHHSSPVLRPFIRNEHKTPKFGNVFLSLAVLVSVADSALLTANLILLEILK